MSNYCCNAVGCSNSTLKKNNVEKYPSLKDVKFRSFPHATREKTTIVDSSAWIPNKFSRVCSKHMRMRKDQHWSTLYRL